MQVILGIEVNECGQISLLTLKGVSLLPGDYLREFVQTIIGLRQPAPSKIACIHTRHRIDKERKFVPFEEKWERK